MPMHSHVEKILFDEATILGRLDEIAEQITRDYASKDLVVVPILHGGLILVADLLRRVRLPLKMECLSVASYHGGTESSGVVTFNQQRMPDLEGADVLIIDDILDSGRTLAAIRRKIEGECSPAGVKICVLLEKRAERAEEVVPDYVGFGVGDEFVIGYGLDYNGMYRNLPYIGTLKGAFVGQ
jgi:hypoxanthine phosphoribosyltransferase